MFRGLNQVCLFDHSVVNSSCWSCGLFSAVAHRVVAHFFARSALRGHRRQQQSISQRLFVKVHLGWKDRCDESGGCNDRDTGQSDSRNALEVSLSVSVRRGLSVSQSVSVSVCVCLSVSLSQSVCVVCLCVSVCVCVRKTATLLTLSLLAHAPANYTASAVDDRG